MSSIPQPPNTTPPTCNDCDEELVADKDIDDWWCSECDDGSFLIFANPIDEATMRWTANAIADAIASHEVSELSAGMLSPDYWGGLSTGEVIARNFGKVGE